MHFQIQQRSPKPQTRGRGRLGVRGRGVGLRGRASGVRGRLSGFRGRQRGRGQEGFTSLNRERMQAINSLIKAKNTLAQIKAKQKEQKQSRNLMLNQRRGLQVFLKC